MAFFDDLSKKITDASTKTIQKGKDLTDVARLNSQISAEENRINTLYGMIGKQYMELHRKDAEDAFAGLVASVAEAEQNIAACRAKITELRTVPHCPNCGKEIKLFGESHIDDVAKELGIPVFGKLPLDPAFAEQADKGAFATMENAYLDAGVEKLKTL